MYLVDGVHYVTQDEAKKAAKTAGTDWAAVDVPSKIHDLATYLNDQYMAAMAREVAVAQRIVDAATPAPVEHQLVSYTETSLNIDDLWDGLPLARKFHFASLALEDARELVPSLTTAPAPAPAADASDLL